MVATYNADAQLISRNDPAGAHTFTYDTLGRLATAYDPLSTRTLNYAYNDAYQITKATYGPSGSSAYRDYGYDNIGRLTSTTMKKSNNVATATETYTYDADDNLTNQQVLFPGAAQTNSNQGTSDYTYDAAGRLARQKRVSSTNGTTTIADYQWDPAGNRTAVFTNAAAQNWTYDQRNRIIAGPDGTYTWDPRGTLDKIMNGATTVADLTFDNFGRLTSLVKSGSTINYTYDALDRVYQRAGASFAYNGTSIDPSLAAGVKYSRSPGERILSVQNGATTALAGINRHGDLRWLMNQTGDLTDTSLYDPFGKTLEKTGSTGANVGFQADYTDPLSGDVWMGARWYSPNDAGFRSRDSVTGQLSTPISLNRYTYAAANPLAFYDPDGHYYETYCDEWVGCYDYWVDDPVYYDYSYVDPCAWGGCYDYSYVDPCAWGGCDYNPPPEPYYDPCAWGGCYDFYYDPAPAPPPEPAPVYDPCAYDMWACIEWVMPEPVYTANYEAADTWSETVYRVDEIDYTWAAVEAGFNPSYSAEAEQAYWDQQALLNAASIDAFGYSIYDAAEIADAQWDAYWTDQLQGASAPFTAINVVAEAMRDGLIEPIQQSSGGGCGWNPICGVASAVDGFIDKAWETAEMGRCLQSPWMPGCGEKNTALASGVGSLLSSVPDCLRGNNDGCLIDDAAKGIFDDCGQNGVWHCAGGFTFDAALAKGLGRGAGAADDATRATTNTVDDILPKPVVSDPKLQNYVDNVYKGTTNPGRVGTGTTADAVRNEILTGQPTGGTFHTIKAQETVNGLTRWLRNNANASAPDRLVAQSLLDDLVDALGTTP